MYGELRTNRLSVSWSTMLVATEVGLTVAHGGGRWPFRTYPEAEPNDRIIGVRITVHAS
jgi:hypothetical protein